MTSLCWNWFRASSVVGAFVFAALLTPMAAAQTVELRVDKAEGELPPPQGNADGSAWGESAFRFLQDALSEAEFQIENDLADAVDIWVAAETYFPDEDANNPNGTGDQDASFELHNNVHIRGGFVGDEQNLGEWDPATAAPTILSGDLNGDDIFSFTTDPLVLTFDEYDDNSEHVVRAEDVDSSAVLDSVTIRGGRSPNFSTFGGGARALSK